MASERDGNGPNETGRVVTSRADSEPLSVDPVQRDTKTKALLGGAAAVLAVAAVWAGGMRPTALPADVRLAREQQIAAMSAGEREQLRQNFAAFGRLSSEEQQRLRDLDRAISSDTDRDELLAVVKRYGFWLGEFKSADRYELKDMPVAQRVDEIARRQVKDYRLPPADVRVVALWLKEDAEARFRKANEKRWERMAPLDRSLMALGQMAGRFERSAGKDTPEGDKLTELTGQLSPASRAQLKIAGDATDQRRALVHWLRQSDIRRQLQREVTREITREQAAEYMGRLSADEQRRWRQQWQENPDRVRNRIFFEREMKMRGPHGRRGSRPRSEFGPDGAGPPPHRDGPGGFDPSRRRGGRPGDRPNGRPRRPGDDGPRPQRRPPPGE